MHTTLEFDTVHSFYQYMSLKQASKCSTFERQYLNHTISFNSNTFSKWASFKKFQQKPTTTCITWFHNQ